MSITDTINSLKENTAVQLIGVLLFLIVAGLIFIPSSLPWSSANGEIKHTNTQTVPDGKVVTPVAPAKFDVEKLYSTIDGYRIYHGVSALTRDLTLDRAAQIHAEDMKARGYYSHTTPEGVTAYTRISNAVGHEVYSGENQDNVCQNVDVGAEFARFTGSPEHDANQLDPRVNTVGVGYVPSDPGTCNGYIVFDFAQL